MPTLTTNGTGRHSAGFDSLGTLQMLEVSRGELPKEYKSWDEINHKIPTEWRNGKAGEVFVVFDTPDTMPDAPNSGSNRKTQVAGLGNQARSIVDENGALLPTVLANSPMRTSRRAMTTKEGGYAHVSLNQAIEIANGILPREFKSWDEVPESIRPIAEEILLPTPLVIDSTGGAQSADKARANGRHVKLQDEIGTLAAISGLQVSPALEASLLPTPVVMDMGSNKNPEEWDEWTEKTKAKHKNGNGHGPSLNVEMLRLLPTPNTMDSLPARTPEQIEEAKLRTPAGYSNLREAVVNDLLPTPQAMEGDHGNNLSVSDRAATGQVMLSNYAVEIANDGPAIQLLSTPQVDDSKNTGHNQNRRMTLASEVFETERSLNWGKFEPAIRRWESVLGRVAPEPTKGDGKEGAHRLSSKFTEWMMGLPEGWITDVGLTRNEELKACGNGVVPQQAALALRVMLAEINKTKKEDK